MSSPVEQIKQRLSVADLIGSYIKLQKAGANFKAVCPFHSEKAPSFYVSPAREIWHCFGCNRGGDIFEFVKQIESVEFTEALRILAERAGVALVFKDPRLIDERARLFDVMEAAVGFYKQCLAENKNVLEYLKKRGLSQKTIDDFRLGFAPMEDGGWRHLFLFLKSRGFSVTDIEKTGLAIKKTDSDFYDRFRGRIMFPLADSNRRVVGFSGRIFGAEKEGVGKYINSPQTELYDKSKILYGFDSARIEIRKRDSCVLVEGQMDLLMSHQAGVINTVAVSGTSLTDFHLGAIKRLTNNLVMAFDGDEAGLAAAKRSIDLALTKEFELRAVLVPKGKDPADVILENSSAWQEMVGESKHIIDFYMDSLKEKYGDSVQFKQAVSRNVLPYLLSIQSEVEKNHWITEMAKRMEVAEESVLKDYQSLYKNRKGASMREKNSGEKFENKKEAEKRSGLLIKRLSGAALWKSDINIIPEFVRPYISEVLEKKDKPYLDRLSLEAELHYTDLENLSEEIEHLSKELKKEILKETLEKLANEIRVCEGRGEKENLDKKMLEFQSVSKELSGM